MTAGDALAGAERVAETRGGPVLGGGPPRDRHTGKTALRASSLALCAARSNDRPNACALAQALRQCLHIIGRLSKAWKARCARVLARRGLSAFRRPRCPPHLCRSSWARCWTSRCACSAPAHWSRQTCRRRRAATCTAGSSWCLTRRWSSRRQTGERDMPHSGDSVASYADACEQRSRHAVGARAGAAGHVQSYSVAWSAARSSRHPDARPLIRPRSQPARGAEARRAGRTGHRRALRSGARALQRIAAQGALHRGPSEGARRGAVPAAVASVRSSRAGPPRRCGESARPIGRPAALFQTSRGEETRGRFAAALSGEIQQLSLPHQPCAHLANTTRALEAQR
jgi:hypothetical protein